MAWMETDYSKHMYFRWKIKWRLEHLGALGIMGEITSPSPYRCLCFHNKYRRFQSDSKQSILIIARLWKETKAFLSLFAAYCISSFSKNDTHIKEQVLQVYLVSTVRIAVVGTLMFKTLY